MKFLKRALPIVLAVCMLASLCAVSAIDAGETRTVIGADLTDEQIKAVTASQVFGVPLDEVTPLQRSHAKAVNFGIVYGKKIDTPPKEMELLYHLAATPNRRKNKHHGA